MSPLELSDFFLALFIRTRWTVSEREGQLDKGVLSWNPFVEELVEV